MILKLNNLRLYGIILNITTNRPRIRGGKYETVENFYTKYATF